MGKLAPIKNKIYKYRLVGVKMGAAYFYTDGRTLLYFGKGKKIKKTSATSLCWHHWSMFSNRL